MKATKEEIQLIFKLRCRMTDIKTNMRGNYKTFECPLCEGAEDTQIHTYQECKVIETQKKNETEKPNYKKLFENDSRILIEIVRIFKENMDIRGKMLKS